MEHDQDNPQAPETGQPDAGTPGAKKGKGEETISISKKEWEKMQRDLAERTESERYWSERARSAAGGGKKAGDEPDEDEEDEVDVSDLVPGGTGNEELDEAITRDPDKWVAAISKGPEAIKQLVKSMGLVSAREAADIAAKVARRTVNVERQKITTDAQIVGEFPELQDPNSELFKLTREHLRDAARLDPRAAETPLGLYMAAKAAKRELDGRKPTRRQAEADDDAYDRYDPDGERDRRRRVASQDTSRRRPEPDDDDEESYLGSQAREVIAKMGITEEQYRESRKELGAGRRRR